MRARCLDMLCALAMFLALATPLMAQSEAASDFNAWGAFASNAERAIEGGRASDGEFASTRSELTKWRSQFIIAQNANSRRINTLKSQLDALGPVPEDGSEREEIAARRALITEQLDRLERPILEAREAFERADGMIGEIDSLLRERQQSKLMERGSSPLNFGHWEASWQKMFSTLNRIRGEVVQVWERPAQRARFYQRLPAIAALIALGVGLIVAARFVLMPYIRGRLNPERPRTPLLIALASFLQLLIGIIGLMLIAYALNFSGMGSVRTQPILERIPVWGGIYLLSFWLAGRLTEKDVTGVDLKMGPWQARQMDFLISSSALWVSLLDAYYLVSGMERYEPQVEAVLLMPVVLLGGLLLYGLGRLTLQLGRAEQEAAEEGVSTYRAKLMTLCGRIACFLAIISPIAAVIGYTQLSVHILSSSFGTLALFGFTLLLQRFVGDVYGAIVGTREALIPVLLGLVITALAMPVLLVIWGVRSSELVEIWHSALEGFSIGETRLSVGKLITFAVIFTIGYTITRFVQGTLKSSVLPKTKIDQGGQTALVSGLGYVGIFLAAIFAITGAGIDLSSLAIVAGALSVGIGFGLQTIVSNFVSGIILLIERPISEGDWIEVGGQMGYVRDISVRATRIETFDRTNVIVPNADLVSNQVINWTSNSTVGRVIVSVGVAHGSDVAKVEAILREISEAHSMVLLNPAPTVLFVGIEAEALQFQIRAILRDVNWVMSVKSDMNHQIIQRFAEEGITIAFPQRDLWFRNGIEFSPAGHGKQNVAEEDLGLPEGSPL